MNNTTPEYLRMRVAEAMIHNNLDTRDCINMLVIAELKRLDHEYEEDERNLKNFSDKFETE